MIARALIVALTALLVGTAGVSPAAADDTPDIPWTGTNAYDFTLGDSLTEQCGEGHGMGWRSLGMIGWPGATTQNMRDRLTADTEGWPFTTEPSNFMERIWFRDAGSLTLSFGTNDVKFLTVEQWRANIDWFMEQSRGRPVLWFDINNPFFQPAVDSFNAELHAAADRWPNLKILPWVRWVADNPSALQADRVHVATGEYGCQRGRDTLVRLGAPDVPGQTAPHGFWYWNPSTTGPVVLNGWGAGNADSRRDYIAVNVRSDFGHVGRFPVTQDTGDLYANAASGRGFADYLNADFRGHLICLDLVDAREQFTSLGCRTV